MGRLLEGPGLLDIGQMQAPGPQPLGDVAAFGARLQRECRRLEAAPVNGRGHLPDGRRPEDPGEGARRHLLQELVDMPLLVEQPAVAIGRELR